MNSGYRLAAEHKLDVDIGDFAAHPEQFPDLPVGQLVRHWARTRTEAPAFITPGKRVTWHEYDATADRIATALAEMDDARGPVALYLPDTMVFHAALVGTNRAGRLAVGIGARSGVRELAQLMRRAQCRTLVTTPAIRDQDSAELVETLRADIPVPLTLVIVTDGGSVQVLGPDGESAPAPAPADVPDAAFGTAAVSLLNSTSGTTGLPKLVTQTERRWIEFCRLAVTAGEITGSDVFCGMVPAPFGFGLWTAHFLPALLGAPIAVLERFDVDTMIDLIERDRVTVLHCVSTQFKMLLRSPRARSADLSSLRVMFTGGEAVPYSEAVAFEERTGASVLQFYGSNETGAVSCTTIDDDVETRLTTCGHVIEQMHVRIFDSTGAEVSGTVRRGQPAVKGPLMCHGYWDDEAANRELFTPDGWMLLGDIVEVDSRGRVRVMGREADIIIRGGKNISAVEVEELVRTHPAVELVSAVGVSDDLFGERVCAVVVTKNGEPLTTDELAERLIEDGATREYIPEYVVTVEQLPMAAGGKVAKGEVKKLAESVLAVGDPQ